MGRYLIVKKIILKVERRDQSSQKTKIISKQNKQLTNKKKSVWGEELIRKMKNNNEGSYFNNGNWRCQFAGCTDSGSQSGCSSLLLTIDGAGNINSAGVTSGSTIFSSFNAQTISCTLTITCNYHDKFSTNPTYTISASLLIAPSSTPTATCSNQNNFMTNSSSLEFFYLKSSGSTPQTVSFSFDQSPSTTCYFNSCFLSLDQTASNPYTLTSFIQTTMSTLTITSQIFQFSIDVSVAQSLLSVYTGCYVNSPPADVAFEAYSEFQLTFLVCDYTKVTQSDTILKLNQAGLVNLPIGLLNPSSLDCDLLNCNLYDTSGSLQTQLVTQQTDGSFNIDSFPTNLVMSALYYIQCTGILSSLQKSNNFKVSVVCSNSVTLQSGSTSYSASFTIGTYNSTPPLSNFTSNSSDCPVKTHQICSSSTTGCSLSDFTLTQSSGTSTFTLNYLSGTQSSYSYFILATADGGSQLSQPITITLTCGPNSVTVLPTSISTQYYYLKQASSAYNFNNFTTTDPRCPIQQHQIDQSGSYTSMFSLTEGSSKFWLTIINTNVPVGSYTININGTAIGGANKIQQVTFIVQCASNSVIIYASSSFISSQQFYFSYQQSFSFSNFTSSDTRCPILSHKIVVSYSNISSPSEFQLTEGTSKQQISYILTGGFQQNYSFYVLAAASGGAQLFKQMQISVQCGPNSVLIGTPSTFRQTQTFLIGQQSVFIYSNFTSNDTRCPIIKHSLVESHLNQTQPSQFSIIEGTSQFQIDYISIGGSPTLYSFFVKIQALGGATVYKPIFIQSLMYYDCSIDQISMIQTLPDKSNANFKLYSLINSYPALKLNQSLGKSFSADISSSFQNAYGSNCPLTYNIEQVTSQGNVISSSDYNNIFKLSSSGSFQISANADQPINNYLVYIQACNAKICYQDLQHYQLDISLFQKVNQVKNVTFSTVRKGNYPYFQNEPQNITINIAKTFGSYIYYLPEVSKDTSSAFIKQTSQGQKIDILFNKNSMNAILVFYQQDFKKVEEVFVQVTLKNEQGQMTDYNITVNYIYLNPKNVSASIKKIDKFGLMTIYFNDSMVLNDSVSWINYSLNKTIQFNTSWINSSNTNIYLQPANHREQDANFNMSQIEFNWNVVSISNRIIQIQLNFTFPLQISPQVVLDKIIVQFNGSQYLLMSSETKMNLHPLFWTLSQPIDKQMSNDQSTQTFLSSIASGQTMILTLLVFGIIFNQLGGKILGYMRLMIRSLQLILHLPIMEVSLPSNVVAFINSAISFVMFDVFFTKTVWAYMPFIQFNNNIQAQALNQMQNVGYIYRNAFQGLAAITFFVFLYFLRFFLSIILKIVIFFTNKQSPLRKRLLKYYLIVSKEIFFNQILGFSLDVYMEFYINSLMNLQTADYSTNGEILGISLSYFSAIMIHGVLPILTLFIITRKQKELVNTPFAESVGELYENTKIDSRLRLAYTLMFIIRRALYLTLGMFILDPSLGGLQIDFLMLLNLLAIIYIGHASAQKTFEDNFIEFVNEIFVQAATAHLVFFTDFVQDLNVQFMYGWYMIACIGFVFVFNFYYVFREIGKLLSQYFHKYNNLFQFHQKQKAVKTETQQTIKQQVEDIIKQREAFDKIIEMQKEIYILKNKSLELKTKPNSVVTESTKVQDMRPNKVDPKVIAQMLGRKYKKKEQLVEIQEIEETDDSKSEVIEQKLLQNTQSEKTQLSKYQIQINQGILKNQRKYFADKSNVQKQFKKKKQISKHQIQEDKREFLKNVRTQRLFNERKNGLIYKDNICEEFKTFIEKYEYILESCQSQFNSLEDLKKDIQIFAIEDGETVQQLAFKEHQLIEYVHNLVFFKSTLKNPILDYKNFEKDFQSLIEQKIQYN